MRRGMHRRRFSELNPDIFSISYSDLPCLSEFGNDISSGAETPLWTRHLRKMSTNVQEEVVDIEFSPTVIVLKSNFSNFELFQVLAVLKLYYIWPVLLLS